jgi:hypothetical protein
MDPARVQGIERPAVEEGDAQRSLAAGVFFVPREMVRLAFVTGGVTAGLIRDEQVVPRVGELLSPSPGNVSLFPSLFLDTRRRASVGATMIASGKESGTRLSFGFGGVHDLLGEARARFGFHRPLPLVLSFEALADERSTLDYLGLGQDPETDARNRFRSGAPTHQATYFETRARAIVSAGVRVGGDVEIFLSSGFTRSRVEDSPGGGPATITRVFDACTVAGAPAPRGCGLLGAESRLLYSELALRLDTRATTGRPSAGVLLEGYAGLAQGIGADADRFYRVGGRAALFASILRSTNILSPKLVLDGMVVPSGSPEPPFTALVGQPDYRGIDTRLDRLSLVASLDYRFSIVRYLGARVFLDMATVGPDIGTLLAAPKRFAGGFGFDVFSSATQLAEMTLSISRDGPSAFITFGVPSKFGDRQHRR